jgi:hypothetical protein
VSGRGYWGDDTRVTEIIFARDREYFVSTFLSPEGLSMSAGAGLLLFGTLIVCILC